MAKQNAKPLQVLIGQVVQNLGVDGVLTECRLILFEAKAPQPTSDVHRGPQCAWPSDNMISQAGEPV